MFALLEPEGRVRSQRTEGAPNLVLIGSDTCLLYTSDAADERSSVDLGGRRIIKTKKDTELLSRVGSDYKCNVA